MLLICRCHSNATVIGLNRVGEREHSSWCSTRVRGGRSTLARLIFAVVTTKWQPQQFDEASQTLGDERTRLPLQACASRRTRLLQDGTSLVVGACSSRQGRSAHGMYTRRSLLAGALRMG